LYIEPLNTQEMKTKFMSSKIGALALASLALLHSASLSQAAVLWSNTFDGDNADVQYDAVGAGWPGNWFDQQGGTVSITSGVMTTTGFAAIKADTNTTFSDTVGEFGTLWMSFDWEQVTAQNSWGGITFFGSSLNELGKVGNTDNSGFWNAGNATPTSTISTQGMKTGVARIVLGGAGNSTVDLWVGATDSPVNVSGTALATATNMNLSDTRYFRFMGGDSQRLDNFVVGTTMASVGAVPEPSAALLGGLGALALLRRRRR
jgi:hypothetical protein